MKIAIKIGGSILCNERGINRHYLKKISPIINDLKKKCELLILGIGGGKFVRNYFSTIRDLCTNEEMEWIGIDLLRANARFLAYYFGGKPVFDLNEIPKSRVLTISGIAPNRSTDANTILLGVKKKINLFIVLTNVDGIYDRNPKLPNAKLIKNLTFEELDKLKKKSVSPGNYGVVDNTALDIIKEYKIHTYVINGKNPNNLLKVVNGINVGTEIC
ncbi:MAG: hypothetical protein B6U88_03055 [Candidatus Aenigmarchaeota archaeon ex4484_56]|nr:MAG: hypothetical protein B6U88_03055 [Candidatus Aenigmarchaeota archaeon ex4484_56]